MEHGEQCELAECRRLSFLPLRCAHCRRLFCEAHAPSERHGCELGEGGARGEGRGGEGETAAASATPRRVPCSFAGCRNKTLELETAANTAATADTAATAAQRGSEAAPPSASQRTSQHPRPPAPPSGSLSHRAPRCANCKLAFCASHATPTSHRCRAAAPPTEGELRRRAAEERKRRARDVLAKHFPQRRT